MWAYWRPGKSCCESWVQRQPGGRRPPSSGNPSLFSLLLFSFLVMSDSLWPHGLQHTRLPCPSPSPGACSNSCPLSPWCHPTILPSVIPFSSCLQSFPTSESLRKSRLFASGDQHTGVELQLRLQSFQWIFRTDFLLDWLVWSPYSPRDSKEPPLIPQFESIDSLTLNLLYGPTLTSIHDYWKNHSFDCTDFWWQSNVSAF